MLPATLTPYICILFILEIPKGIEPSMFGFEGLHRPAAGPYCYLNEFIDPNIQEQKE